MTLAACTEQFWAWGWKAKTIALRVFKAIKALNIVVEVGLVVGTIPAKTPNGAAILTWPLILSSEMTPTVFSFLIKL